jgi:hypothetical protein
MSNFIASPSSNESATYLNQKIGSPIQDTH